MPYAWSRKRAATSPSATRAAVSRAEARSSTGRASSKAYFCMPTRSAWPGRGRVSGRLRAISFSALTSFAAARSSAATGSGLITVCHLGHSLLPTRIAMGDPSVTPCRTPPRNSTSSRSKDIRAPRPWPSRRRARARARSSLDTSTPAGSPSIVATRAGPCDSPAVNQRSMARILSRVDQPPDSQVRIRDVDAMPTHAPRHIAGP